MKKKAVLFDMDGVLVDVSQSYRLAVKQTAERFLDREISLEVIQQYKNRGGLNNDWDLTEQLLLDHGLKIGKEKIIAVFQQFYKGENHNGLIRHEQWMIPRETLAKVARHFKTGIVTGRPRAEAMYTLKHFDMLSFFPVVIVMEDVPPGQGKPNPLGLRLALEKLGAAGGWYLGDTIDDMLAAKGAGLIPVGVVHNCSPGNPLMLTPCQPEVILRQAGALDVITDFTNAAAFFKQLAAVIGTPPRGAGEE